MKENPPVSQVLHEIGVAHSIFRHPGPIHSLEQAAQERDQKPEQVVRSIVFRLAQGEYAMVLIAGPAQVAWPALRHYLGQSRLTMASHEEVLSVTGYESGAVSPFGLPNPMRILVDRSVLKPEEISIGSGMRGVTVILLTEDLMRALGKVEIGDFSASE